MNYRLHPEARRDLREAARYYRERVGPSLARLFLNEFEHTVELLVEHPALGAVWHRDKRRFIVRRFPYAVIYTAAESEIHILAVSHNSRRPEH